MEWTHSEAIDAPAEVVWQLTTDVGAWPTFMPTVTSVERLDDGPLRVGATARIKQPGQRTAAWTVTEFTPGSTFSWRSQRRGMAMVGSHRVAPEGTGSRSTLTLTMSGPLTPVLGRLLGPLMRRVLRTENACFKSRSEAVARQGATAAPEAG
jgi:uncharacterized membrane protein